MKTTHKILLINLIILIVYSAFSFLSSKTAGQYNGMEFGLLMLMLVFGHSLINFIIAIALFINGDNVKAKTFLLSSGLIVLIGFSACVGVLN